MNVYIRHIDEITGRFVGEFTPEQKDKFVEDLKEYGALYECNVTYHTEQGIMEGDKFYWEIIIEDDE